MAGCQRGVVARWQLARIGCSPEAVRNLIRTGRLYPVARGVYAAGRPHLDELGRWAVAVLGCGPSAALSHGSAASLWEIGEARLADPEVSVPAGRSLCRPGVVVHRRSRLREWERTVHRDVPVTSVAATIIDLAAYSRRSAIERAIRDADRLDLLDPEELRAALDAVAPRPGVGVLREILDPLTFVLPQSELERLFLPLARAAGLPAPVLQAKVNGFDVDFFWPDLGLVVETDGLRYHRTPSQQARDRRRDNVHLASGLTPLRFTHGQVRFEPGYVTSTLAVTARRLATPPRSAAEFGVS